MNIRTALVLVATLLLSPIVVIGHESALVFGIHPYLPATKLVERFTPLSEYISSQIGRHVNIRVATSYQDHINAISQGEVDFAYMGPASYIKLTELNDNASLLGRLNFSGKDTFRGAIIVRSDSSITSLSQLSGKRFAFGDPNSTLSSLIPKRLLADSGVGLSDLSKYSHLKNHHNVALAVLLGKYDAGGVKEEVYKEYKSRGLKVLKWSPKIPTHPFVSSPKMTPKNIAELRQILYKLHLQPNGLEILQKIKKGTTSIVPANIRDYAGLRDLIKTK
ncbi:MAG TPA: phosphate/phosphite/phosphonate ABC transporter substrate-binding protein [Ectothiorhodospiraceae bacterium]|nr:phosphate/phosphite/phosphonate ABC transporter substrate-binding protein [Ectothiorhodospiraceae bacterium]